jgi:hypothetical protein
MGSDQQPLIDWVNLPESTSSFSLWDALHDGDVLAIESDLLARSVTMRFDVGYVRKFYQLSEQTQFVMAVRGVQSVRSLRSVPWPGEFSIPQGVSREQESVLISEYQRKWREESQSWSALERLTTDGLEVSNATLIRGSNVVALRLVLLVADGAYVEAYIRGDRIDYYIGEKQVTLDEFVALGEAYWQAFASGRKRD